MSEGRVDRIGRSVFLIANASGSYTVKVRSIHRINKPTKREALLAAFAYCPELLDKHAAYLLAQEPDSIPDYVREFVRL